jgi:hypothetical protein
VAEHDSPRGMGLLAAVMEPQQGGHDEFNDWYDLEHLGHMSSIPGVLTATRFVVVDGWPRYLALYDLEGVSILSSEAYRSVTGGRFSPWSRRILRSVRGWRRLTFSQSSPGRAALDPQCGVIDLLLVAAAPESAIASSLRDLPGTLQVRTFQPAAGGPAAILVESGTLASPTPVDLAAALGPDGARALRWSARAVRYTRADPLAAFSRLEAERSP